MYSNVKRVKMAGTAQLLIDMKPRRCDADVYIKLSDIERFRDAFYKIAPQGIILNDRRKKKYITCSHECLCYDHEVGYPSIHLDIYPLIGAPNDVTRQIKVWKRNYNLDRIFRSKYIRLADCLPQNRNKVRIVKFIDSFIPNSFINRNIRKRENEYNIESKKKYKS